MTFPSVDLYPGPDLFPGDPLPVDVGGYSQLIEVAVNGLVLTATDHKGCDWIEDTLTGWFGSPASTISPQPRSRAPGSYPGPRQMASRGLTLGGVVEAPSLDALQDASDRLNEAASLDAAVLTVSAGVSTRSMIVYRQGEVSFTPVSDLQAVWTMTLFGADPRKFATSLTRSTGLPSTSGGFGLPLKFPFGIPSKVVTGRVAIYSPGNYTGPVFVRIDGPVTGPFITHRSSGRRLVLGEALTLASGEWLDIDMENKTVLANGQASRSKWISARGWSGFEKGENEWQFSAAVYNPNARATFTVIPAWQ